MRVILDCYTGRLTEHLSAIPLGRRSAGGVHLGHLLSCDLRALAAAGVETYGDLHRAARAHDFWMAGREGGCLEDVPGVDPRTIDALDRNHDALQAAFESRRHRPAPEAPVAPQRPRPCVVAALEALLAEEGPGR